LIQEEKIDSQQTQRVVVNLRDWRGNLGDLQQQFSQWPMPGLKEVKAVLPSGEVIQIPLPGE
jgi:hypothetical protein